MRKTNKHPAIDRIRMGESYTSLLLGIAVVIVFAFLLTSILKTKEIFKNFSGFKNQEISSSKTEEQKPALNEQIIYTVLEGDDLGIISTKFYNTGDYWGEIAKANKMENPNILETGTKLIIPQIKPTGTMDQSTLSITDSTYTVQEGEDLWGIALRAYGDAYAWTKIAQANNLFQPDAISAGTVLKIPR